MVKNKRFGRFSTRSDILINLCWGRFKGNKNMWEAEKEFELYEEVQDYELEDDGTDDFADLELNPSANKDEDGLEYEDDLYDEEDRD